MSMADVIGHDRLIPFITDDNRVLISFHSVQHHIQLLGKNRVRKTTVIGFRVKL